jgi:hypothetical protein
MARGDEVSKAAAQRADEILEVNRRALDQLPAGAVPANGTVWIEAEVVPTNKAREVQLVQWRSTTVQVSSGATWRAAGGMRETQPTNSGPAGAVAPKGTSSTDRIEKSRVPAGVAAE